MLITIVEQLLRNRTRLRRLPKQFRNSPIIVSTAGGLSPFLRRMSQVDPILFRTAEAIVKPADTVWDIGANIGLFSVAAAAKAGRCGAVFAFEPDLSLVALLRRTAGMQPKDVAPISVVPCGVAGKTGIRSFAISSRSRALNSLTEYGHGGDNDVMEVQRIVCLSTADLLTSLAKPDVVKIDVEGAELELLAASKYLLTNVRPVLACEIADYNRNGVTEILHEKGYVLFNAGHAIESGSKVDAAEWNTIAIPKEKL